jgi:hypothetical protein
LAVTANLLQRRLSCAWSMHHATPRGDMIASPILH